MSSCGYSGRKDSPFAFICTIGTSILKFEDKLRTEVLLFAAVTSSLFSARNTLIRNCITMEQKPEFNCVAELYTLFNIRKIY